MTQVLWESMTGNNPSRFKEQYSVGLESWLDNLIFANQLSEKEELEGVQNPQGMEEGCKNQTEWYDEVLDEYAQSVK